MLIRKLKEKDYPVVKEMLEKENASHEYKYLINCDAYVIEDKEIIGFFGFDMKQDLPSLNSFCLNKKHRSFSMARILINSAINYIKNKGFDRIVIPSNRKYLNKLIEYKFKTKPFSIMEKFNFYLVEV